MRPRIQGKLKITTTDIETGEVIDVYGFDKNMVVDSGVDTMWLRAATDDVSEQYRLDTIHLGDDYGSDTLWGIFNPEPPSRGFTSANQNVTHVLQSVQFDFPTDEFLRVTASVSGTELMNTYFPAEIDYRFTSATLRFNNGSVFSYKRFPIRSISRAVNVEFDWRFSIINAEEWCADDE